MDKIYLLLYSFLNTEQTSKQDLPKGKINLLIKITQQKEQHDNSILFSNSSTVIYVNTRITPLSGKNITKCKLNKEK